MSSSSKSAARASREESGVGAFTRALRLAEAERDDPSPGRARAETQGGIAAAWSGDTSLRTTAAALLESLNDRTGRPVEIDPGMIPALVSGGLTAPVLGADVPAQITVSRTAGGETEKPGATLELARALLDAGVCEESDFRGGFAEAIGAGVARWVNRCLGGRDGQRQALRVMSPLCFVYSDDADHWEEERLVADDWMDQNDGDDTRRVGFFALMWDEQYMQEVYVRRRVLALEEFFPGLGCSVLGLLFHLGLFHLWTFGDALERVKRDCEDMDQEDLRDSTFLTPERFCEKIPRRFCNRTWRRADVEEAMRLYRAGALAGGADFTEIEGGGFLDDVLALDCLMDEYARKFRRFGEIYDFNSDGISPHGTAYLKWQESDEMVRVIDDHYTSSVENGELSNFVWAFGWQPGLGPRRGGLTTPPAMLTEYGSAGSIAGAIEATSLVLRMAARLDKVLSWLGEGDEDSEGADLARAA